MSALLIWAAMAGGVQANTDETASPAPEPWFELGWNGLSVADDGASAELHLLMRGAVEVQPTRPSSQTGITTLRPLVRIASADGRFVTLHQLELGSDPQLLDARADLQLGSRASVGLGRMVVPLNRSWLTPLPLLAGPDRPLSTAVFAPGRRAGASLHAQTRAQTVEAWGGLFSATAPGEPSDGLHAPSMVVRAQYNPAGVAVTDERAAASKDSVPTAASFGGGLWHEGGMGIEPATTTVTLDLGVQLRTLVLVAEAFDRMAGASGDGPLAPSSQWGGAVQLSGMGPARKLLLGGRLGTQSGGEANAGVPELVETAWATALIHASHATATVRVQQVVHNAGSDEQSLSAVGQLWF